MKFLEIGINGEKLKAIFNGKNEEFEQALKKQRALFVIVESYETYINMDNVNYIKALYEEKEK